MLRADCKYRLPALNRDPASLCSSYRAITGIHNAKLAAIFLYSEILRWTAATIFLYVEIARRAADWQAIVSTGAATK
jgi:hypothetical protein